MLLRGFRLFGVALHREPKGTKRIGRMEEGKGEAYASKMSYLAEYDGIQVYRQQGCYEHAKQLHA